MPETILKVENLSKKYTIGTKSSSSLRETLVYGWNNFIKKSKDESKDFWALKDISFKIKQGEVLGIIGKNGAGKSTLLKILSRITEPTSGTAELNGRVSSLLEVGTGFHPELTGRENIFLNGTILGMSRKEVKEKFDEIVDFSGVEKFIDTSVKHYSSGMYVRLAFAVAANLEPEILIIDEVLAVGDAEFQKKCLGKMKDVSEKEGRTVLFVSHNMGAVNQLCSRCILLSNGEKIIDNLTEEVIKKYIENKSFDNSFVSKSNNKNNNIILAFLTNEKGESINDFFENDTIFLNLNVNVSFKNLNIGVALKDSKGNKLFTSVKEMSEKIGNIKLQVQIPNNLLLTGFYSFDIAVFIKNGIVFDYLSCVCSFNVLDINSEMAIYGNADVGVFNIVCKWKEL